MPWLQRSNLPEHVHLPQRAGNNRVKAWTRGGRPGKQSGYLLLPVAVAIALIGVIGFMISSQSAIEVELAAGELETARAGYVAQAGMQHALRHHAQQGCGPYTDLADYPFATDKYDTQLTHDLGGTAAYTVDVDQDAWIRDNLPTANHGSEVNLNIRYEGGVIERALVRYDLSSIPAKAAILSATAWFYVYKEHPQGPVDIHRITPPGAGRYPSNQRRLGRGRRHLGQHERQHRQQRAREHSGAAGCRRRSRLPVNG
jgi:hypothetical protein